MKKNETNLCSNERRHLPLTAHVTINMLISNKKVRKIVLYNMIFYNASYHLFSFHHTYELKTLFASISLFAHVPKTEHCACERNKRISMATCYCKLKVTGSDKI